MMERKSDFMLPSPFRALVLAVLFLSYASLSWGKEYNVEDYGAKGDGIAINTKQIQNAIDECSQMGGGRVVVPSGEFVSGSLFLKDNVELHLFAGARLIGSPEFSHYPPIGGRWEGVERLVYSSLLTALDAKNISVSGSGTIDGNGAPWWEANKGVRAARRKAELFRREDENPPDAPLKWPRPRVMNFYRCVDVEISGITIIDSPSWTIHPVYCENVLIDGLTIRQPYHSPNTDGIDPDSCKNVRILNCYISCGDDCIAIKSGYNEDGRRVGRPSENIVIANCVFLRGRGGVTIGSETAGDVRNVTISNCVFDGTLRAIRFKSGRGRGGVIENVLAQNLVCVGIEEAAISITARYGTRDFSYREPGVSTPTLREISIDSVLVDGAVIGAEIVGLPERDLKNIRIRNAQFRNTKRGFVAKMVSGLELSDISVSNEIGESFVFEQVRDLSLDGIVGRTLEQEASVLRMQDVERAFVSGLRAQEETGTLLLVEGAKSEGIRIGANDLEKAKTPIRLDGAAESSVTRLYTSGSL